MTTKHTPGPWKVRLADDSDSREIHDANGAFATCEARNARLIAAAPDLLEALQSLLSVYADAREALGGMMGKDWRNHPTPIMEQAMAAIRKATEG